MFDHTICRVVPAFWDRRRARLFMVRFAMAGAVFGAAGCGRGGLPDATLAGSRSPVIERIEPATGWAGQDYPLEATIHGIGFSGSGNVIVFGPVTIDERASTNGGTEIVFAVPKQQRSRTEVPPMILPVGEYAVTVTTADGTSNAVAFTLTRPGSPPSP